MKKIKIGVIGCGAIAQVHHIPNIIDLQDRYELSYICDVSLDLVKFLQKKFHIPSITTEYRKLLESDIDAVLLCQSDPKTESAVEAFREGKHVLIEKPMCFSVQNADKIIQACKDANTIGQVAYMKLFDPGFRRIESDIKSLNDIRYVQVNHLHPDNSLHLAQFDIKVFNNSIAQPNYEKGSKNSALTQLDKEVTEAIGDQNIQIKKAFRTIAGSMIHDLYGLRQLFGKNTKVNNVNIWNEGCSISIALDYGQGFICNVSWIDLPELWNFKETIEIYGSQKRLILNYPSGFSKGLLSEVTIMDITNEKESREITPKLCWESPFVAELKYFYDTIYGITDNKNSIINARNDIELITSIINKYLTSK
ncbi:MAG: Gfo/Idh/MocA family oxidoreductase [SAR324 cluster bacterium]|nr:Gfo/Idh/MocA family oxidoreductase [SAR324 cluster bacterium]